MCVGVIILDESRKVSESALLEPQKNAFLGGALSARLLERARGPCGPDP